MDARKRKRDEHESDTVAYLRRGAITVLDALDEQLPDVFAAEILPKLSLEDTLNLAQVSKAYRDSVWSVRGVQSLEAKITAHLLKKNRMKRIISKEPMYLPRGSSRRKGLYYATKYGNLPAIRALLQSGVDVNKPYRGNLKFTALWLASLKGDAAVVKELIEAGADVNVRGSAKDDTSGVLYSDVTALYVAAQNGHTPVVSELIKAGADVNVPRSDGCTPLFPAARNGHDACVALLLQAGADVNKADERNMTPLSLALRYEKVVKLLKHFGARRPRGLNDHMDVYD